MPTATKVPNQLFREKSPYLLQHAYNPVNWLPWGEEAFQKATEEDKPIFLSIGYSTCHWCHVMERESFEDQEVAEYLNANYISIKVDREERPDIDNIYMNFCQATTGQGGWPLTVFLTPQKHPFFAGTYFPKNSRYGHLGLLELLNTVKNKWKNNREELEQSAKEIIAILQQEENKVDNQDIDPDIFDEVFETLEKNHDSIYGGFGRAPKFPTPHNLMFLMRYHTIYHNEKALEMVESTLEYMFRGGIFDHLGGGFSRYSTDIKWLVPHFEKMLYDNALLIMAYSEAYQITKRPLYKEVAEKTIAYIMRDMTSDLGGFYSAEDADSEGEEGKFYVWSMEELRNILGESDAKFYAEYYQITEHGNFEEKNILNLIGTSLEKMNENPDLKTYMERLSKKIFEVRAVRIHPHKDDKILTSWNGLMIVAFTMASKMLERPEMLECAEQAFQFIVSQMVDEQGRLYARYRETERKHLGYLDDYAFMIWACIELYEAVYDVKYLKQAISFTDAMIDLFGDEKGNGFYLYGKDAEQLITKPKDIYDGAIPSGNSVAIYNLLRLAKLTGKQEYQERARNSLAHFGELVNSMPSMYGFMLIACMFERQQGQEIVLAGETKDPLLEQMEKMISSSFRPFTVVLRNQNSNELKDINSLLGEKSQINGKATAYICEHFTCQKPIQDIETLVRMLC